MGLLYCYENGDGVIKMINKSSKKKWWACLHDQWINKNIATTLIQEKAGKQVNRQQQQQCKQHL